MSFNIVDHSMRGPAITLYQNGLTIQQVADEVGTSYSTARAWLLDAGVLRSKSDAYRLALRKGRRQIQNITEHKRRYLREHPPAGKTLKSDGYIEYTVGPNKYRGEHVVAMERVIGRKLKRNECVHHIDGNKSNNSIENLRLMTFADHARLHRQEDKAAGREQQRNSLGQFASEART